MKLKILSDEEFLDETYFPNKKSLQKHYDDHVAKTMNGYNKNGGKTLFPPMSMQDYDDLGDTKSKENVTSSNLNSPDDCIGFVQKSGDIVKYNRKNNTVVVYNTNPPKPHTVTFYKVKNDNKYRNLMAGNGDPGRGYARDYKPEDDINNK